jgi:hypothetical protein
MVVVDQQVRFDAMVYVKNLESEPLMVIGTVCAVNYAHKVFHVVYNAGGTMQRTSFRFSDIGDKVQVV